ncbi:MAG: insulinase family protein [Oscillospiraceae bacterium]|nr:insulinase family protein [Oscillospiraceae bacterium]
MNKISYPTVAETLYRTELPNGLTVLVLPRPGFQKCYAHFAVRYGGADRRFFLNGRWEDTPAGVAHFLEHKMFDMADGTNALQTLSADGASPNAYTSSGVTAYHFSCTEGFFDKLRLLLRFVSQPFFTAESVQKEQGIIGQEIRMVADNPYSANYYGLLSSLYAHHPRRESVAGSIESIAEITAETLYHCHEAFYRPCNMVLCVVGDVEPERVAALAEEILPRERQEQPQRDYGAAEELCPRESRWEKAMAVALPQLCIGAKFAPAQPGVERLRQEQSVSLMLSALVGESSPFFQKLYKDGLLSRGFSGQPDYSAGTAHILMVGESRDPQRVLELLRKKRDGVAEQGFDAARFDRCRRAHYGSYLQALDSVEFCGRALASDFFNGFDTLDLFDILPSITAEDCARLAGEMLSDERLALAVVRPA